MATAKQTSQTSCSPLPPEVWFNIIESLPRDTARTCLSVCRLFHGIALPIVFARIILTFGAFEVGYYPVEVLLRNFDRVRMLEETGQRHALELLDRMASDASFAAVVRTLQVQACPPRFVSAEERKRSLGAMVVSDWTDRLLTAIPLLKRLRTFSWHDKYPSPKAVVRQLADSCPLLECFEAPFSSINMIPLHHLKDVKMIRAIFTGEGPPHMTGIQSRTPGPVLMSLYKTLRRPLSGGVPHCLLNTITDLELWFYNRSPEDLEEILRSARQLESLALLPFGEGDTVQQGRMYSALSAIPRDLTRIHSLTIGSGRERLQPSQLNLLCGFIISRPRLRRMMVRSSISSTDSGLFFHELMTLGELQVLGIALECHDRLVSEWIDLLLTHVPNHLTALAVNLQHGYANQDTFSKLWSFLPNLQFMHVQALPYGLAVLTPNQFIRGASDSLRVICFQGHFYDVEWTTDGPRVVLPPWSSRKVRFRMAEDFGHADSEWLMRYYNFFDYMPASW